MCRCMSGKKGNKALEMKPAFQKSEHQEYFDYGKPLQDKNEIRQRFKISTIKGSQFRQPLLEFHGACAGCGETPYAKLATQLFGERMYIANATGCSSIWANSSPSVAYCISHNGKSPAWSNSLFEDGAEFGLGMAMAHCAVRTRMKSLAESLMSYENITFEVKSAISKWIETYENGEENSFASDELIQILNKVPFENRTYEVNELINHKEYISKKSFWVFGGDGFAYDIGFGGIDHIIASGYDINILIFDTEVYSNTGGQSSKATPIGADAKFASGGKKTVKKVLRQ